jgi:hypothetical protein
MSFWLLAEPLRLAAGRYGNLHENVCDLCGSSGQVPVSVGHTTTSPHVLITRVQCMHHTSFNSQVPWLVLFVVLTVIPVHGTCYYMLIIGYVSALLAG